MLRPAPTVLIQFLNPVNESVNMLPVSTLMLLSALGSLPAGFVFASMNRLMLVQLFAS